MRRLPESVVSAFNSVGAKLFGVLVVIVFANILAWLALEVRDFAKAHGGGGLPDNPWALRQKVYPDLAPEEIYELFMETWEWRGYEYNEMSQFREAPFSGRFVNVSEQGYRRGLRAHPWPPSSDAFNIFVFGGSTTFGYGMPDWQTVTAFMEEILEKQAEIPVRIYNFGRAYFFSTHELLDYQRLLMAGAVPDAVIFIDGINEFSHPDDKLLWSDRVRTWKDKNELTLGNALRHLLAEMPAYKLTDFVIRYFGDSVEHRQERARRNIVRIIEGGNEDVAERVIDRYLKNKALITTLAAFYGSSPYFVWHPVPTYKYDLEHHLFAYREMRQHVASGTGYSYAFDRYTAGDFGLDFIWCADIQEGIERPLYVDAVHFNAELTRMLAECIVERSDIRQAIDRRGESPH